MEWVGPRIRGRVVTIYEYAYSIGYILFPSIFYFVRHFRVMQAMVSSLQVISVVLIVFIKIVPESPRWQLIHGQYKAAEKSLKTAAKLSGKLTTDEINSRFNSLKSYLIKEQELLTSETKKSLIDLLKIRRLLILSLILYYTWFSHAFIWYGALFNIGNLGGNAFFNFGFFGVSNFVAITIAYIILPHVGRKTIIFCCCFSQAFCFLLMIPFSFDEKYALIRIALATLGNVFASISYHIVYLYTAETYPTTLRQVGIGSCSLAARVGSILAPFVKEMVSF